MSKARGSKFANILSQARGSDLDEVLHAPTPEAVVTEAARHGLVSCELPVAALQPDPQQLRRLPHPNRLQELVEQGDRMATTLLAELQELGQSIKAHGQQQPIIVYPWSVPARPDVTHQLLVGQRRWSGAYLLQLPTLWSIVVPPPAAIERIQRQFEENVRRKPLNDMEYAWAVEELKQALQAETGASVPWAVVETHLRLSTQRRQDLLRLQRFPMEDQQRIAWHGWSEWTLRPLHQALEAQTLTVAQGTTVLDQLAAQASAPTQTTVATLVKALQGTPSLTTAPALRRVRTVRRAVDQLRTELPPITDAASRAAVTEELTQVVQSIQAVLQELDDRG